MTAEFNSGAWDTDDLLVKSLELKDKFYWQSHTLSHLSRDNLGQSDCDTEDGGKACMYSIIGQILCSYHFHVHSPKPNAMNLRLS